MASFINVLVLSTLSVLFIAIVLKKSVSDLIELETCPLCYGQDFCSEIQQGKVSLQYTSFKKFCFNIFSVKNVYFAKYINQEVVIKKLVDTNELLSQYKDLNDFVIKDNLRKFSVCDIATGKKFFDQFRNKTRNNLLTILNANPEPLILELFPSPEWPVPKLYGYCGRVVVEENCGLSLNDLENFNWLDRAYVALQLLEASENFTFNHKDFRLYLTDISPDNIAIKLPELKAYFIDLEHVILQSALPSIKTHHFSTDATSEEEYSFSVRDICASNISDHNIYSVCKLLLSRHAPWPMMKEGLLHSVPSDVNSKNLFQLVEQCVSSNNRFSYSTQIKDLLLEILNEYQYFLNKN